jgi:hypothetical protein
MILVIGTIIRVSHGDTICLFKCGHESLVSQMPPAHGPGPGDRDIMSPLAPGRRLGPKVRLGVSVDSDGGLRRRRILGHEGMNPSLRGSESGCARFVISNYRASATDGHAAPAGAIGSSSSLST